MVNVPVEVVNPLNRVPLALILDDSAPCVNLSRYWIPDRATWKQRHYPGEPLHRADGDPERIRNHPDAIPADFVDLAETGEFAPVVMDGECSA